MNVEKVSIIVPVYNAERYLPECIESLVAQTYRNIEIILVDDGSPDNCGRICDEYTLKDSRISVIHQKNGGLTSARRTGVENATGEWLTFVDSDDTLPLNAIKILVDSSEGFECVKGLFFWGKKIQYPSQLSVYSREECIKLILKSLSTLCAGIYKRELFNGNNVLDIPSYIIPGEDLLALIKIVLKLDQVKYTDEIVYNYRKNPDSITHKFVPTYDYALSYDDCFMSIFKEEDRMSVYDEDIFKKRISAILPLMGSPTMKMRSELIKRIRTDHKNTPKSIGQRTTLWLAEMPYVLRKPLYRVYSKVNNAVYNMTK